MTARFTTPTAAPRHWRSPPSGPQEEARITNVLATRGHRRAIPGLTGVWHVTVPNTFHPADLHQLDGALLRCEEMGLKRLRYAPGDPAIGSLLRQGVSASDISASPTPDEPRAYVYVRGVGGFAGEGIEPLPDELADALQAPEMQSKIEKLARSGLDERHLFLHVRPSAFSFPVYDGLSFGGPLPTRPAGLPAGLPGGLTQVWLFTGFTEGGTSNHGRCVVPKPS